VKGDGLWGSIKDGFEGTVGGRVTEALASKFGVGASTASTASAEGLRHQGGTFAKIKDSGDRRVQDGRIAR
jgi:hypothetical protein